jgi:small subunit ribosomal protein S20
MANHKSAKKRHLQSEKQRVRNRAIKSILAGKVKKARTAISIKAATQNSEEIRAAQTELAIAARKGVISKKTASRRTSRLMKQANKL